MTKVVEIY